MNLRFHHVGVLLGGVSHEREISIRSGKAVAEALKGKGLRVDVIDIGANPEAELRSLAVEAAFIALHGQGGEDGQVQEILEGLGIPYTGSGPVASRMAFYKDEAKTRFIRNDITTPAFQVCTKPADVELIKVEGPWVIKPIADGSSIGVEMVADDKSLNRILRKRLAKGEKLIIEERICGRELTVGILGDRALPIIELRTKRDFYDYAAKYTEGLTEYLLPAPISEKDSDRVSECALRAHRCLGLRGFSRVDLMLSEEGIPFVLEVNSIPGFTNTSLLPKTALKIGLDFGSLCLEILNSARLETVKQKDPVLRTVL